MEAAGGIADDETVTVGLDAGIFDADGRFVIVAGFAGELA